jgi:hypothetical protein
MAVDRITGIAAPRPLPPGAEGAGQRATAAGEIMHLRFAQMQGDDLLAATDDGRSLRLAGLAGLGQGLAQGDVLLVRVLAAAPHLDLEFLGTLARSGSAQLPPPAPAEPASMRTDQAALRQLCWREPNAAALAAAWRVLVYGRWRDGGLPGGADGYPALVPGALRGDQWPSAIDRWTFPVYAWGGLPMMLRLVRGEGGEGGEAGEHGAAPHRHSPPLALCIELDLPGVGRLLLLLQCVTGGLQLTLRVHCQAALQAVRGMLPELAAALARADLQLIRCRLIHGTHIELVAPDGDDLPNGPGVAVAASLFRAAAEAVVVLAAGAASAAAAVSPASR